MLEQRYVMRCLFTNLESNHNFGMAFQYKVLLFSKEVWRPLYVYIFRKPLNLTFNISIHIIYCELHTIPPLLSLYGVEGLFKTLETLGKNSTFETLLHDSILNFIS